MATNFPVPSWYKPIAGTNALNTMSNAILPYLSAANQRTVGENLGTFDATKFGSYRTADYGRAPTTLTTSQYREMGSSERAARALASLNRMRNLSGFSADTPGYRYLQSVVGALQKYGGNAGGMSRADQLRYQSEIAALRDSEASTSDVNVSKLADYFASPTLVGNQQLNNYSRTGNRVNFGQRNSRLYG